MATREDLQTIGWLCHEATTDPGLIGEDTKREASYWADVLPDASLDQEETRQLAWTLRQIRNSGASVPLRDMAAYWASVLWQEIR